MSLCSTRLNVASYVRASHATLRVTPLHTPRAGVSVFKAASAGHVSVCAHTHCMSLTHTHKHTLFLSLTHKHTDTHTLSLSLIHIRTLSLSLSHTLNAAGAGHVSVCARTHCLSLSPTRTNTHTLSLSYTHTHTLSLSHTHTRTLSLSHTHTQRRGCWSRVCVRAVRAASDSLTLRASVTCRAIFRLVFRCPQLTVK